MIPPQPDFSKEDADITITWRFVSPQPVWRAVLKYLDTFLSISHALIALP